MSDKNISKSIVSNKTDTHEKSGMHPRNQHRTRYDFAQLTQTCPELAIFVKENDHGDVSIDFSNAHAVKALNHALLLTCYATLDWDIPDNYLCPSIPGRADYIHYLADLLAVTNDGLIPRSVRVLDIGVGANMVYPLIGHYEYGWHFVGVDIDAAAIANAKRIVQANNGLSNSISLRIQPSASAYFKGVIQQGEQFDLTLCNPPFHASQHEANAGTRRKWRGLTKASLAKKNTKYQSAALNFGGQGAELYCNGGEEAFICRMILESKNFAHNCLWFTSLVSKAGSLPAIYRTLLNVGAVKVQTINMAFGQKQSRIVAWTFLQEAQQKDWAEFHWRV